MKGRDVLFFVILAGIIIGVLFILPAGGLRDIVPPTMVCDVKVESSFFYDCIMGNGIKFTTFTAMNWRNTTVLGLTIGEALLHNLYGTNPLQILGIFQEAYDLRWTLTNIDTGKSWVKTVRVTIPALTITYDFATEIKYTKVPAGTYELTLYSSMSFQYYDVTMTWGFELDEGKTGIVWKTSGGPAGEWLIKP